MRNEIFLSFKIVGFDDITHDELSRQIGLTPSKVYVKGEKYSPKSEKLSENNVWIIDSPSPQDIFVNNQLNRLLDILEPKIPVLKSICQKYYCEFSCALYIYDGESTPWLHFDTRYNELVKQLNIEFDLDLYALHGRVHETIDAEYQ